MKFIDEIWKPVVGYEGIYEVSNLGRVKSCERIIIRSNGREINFPDKMMKPSINHKGYEIIDLRNTVSRKGGFVHRLVAIAFIPNPYYKKQVNHKNGIKTDNRVENLEWVTNQENIKHSYEVLGRTNDRAAIARRSKIDKMSIYGELLESYESIKDAEKNTGILNISAVCRGIRKSAGGFKWRYSTENGGGSDVSK